MHEEDHLNEVAPLLCVIEARDWEEPNGLARNSTKKGLTKQSYALLPKIREVRDCIEPPNLGPSGSPWVAEGHPEVSFQAMAGAPMRFHKSRQAGVAERLALLRERFPNALAASVSTPRTGPPHPGVDDLIDSMALAWTARRLVAGEAERLGEEEVDHDGFPMNI